MAIVTRTFIEKSNTIIEGERINLGLNPIMELYYGVPASRGLIYFDVEKIRSLVDDKTYPDMGKLHHVLHMQNVGSLKSKYGHRFNRYNDAERAASFDLVFFLIDKDWDSGYGYDFFIDGFNTINRIESFQCSNWYNCSNMGQWSHNGVVPRHELNAESSSVIGVVHFDKGNESINLDITDTVNSMIRGEIENHGIGIAFAEQYEEQTTEYPQYVGFFTDNTHTFFRPYVETTYDEYINDDRTNFFLDKPNKLYFYANVGGKMVNLDQLPICTVNDAPMTVKQATKGVYYIELTMPSSEYEPETMHYDIWSNITYNGMAVPDKELYFTTKAPEGYYSFGLPYETKTDDKLVPYCHGINHQERIVQGDIRKVNTGCKIAYTTKQEPHVDSMEYRLYIKDTDVELDAISWTPVEMGYNESFFYVNTNELVPGKYFVGIRIKRNHEVTIHDDMFEFEIVEKSDKPIAR